MEETVVDGGVHWESFGRVMGFIVYGEGYCVDWG